MTGLLTPKSYLRLWTTWLLIAAATLLLCMYVGPADPTTHAIGWGFPATHDLWKIRALRVIPTALVGFALAASGVTLQALLRNPLADPYVLGISSGSSVGVIAWLLVTESALFLPLTKNPATRWLVDQGVILPALAGALLSGIAVFALARPRRGSVGSGGGADALTLLLVGVVVSSINQGILMLLNSLAPAGVKADLINYMLGSISNDLSWTTVLLAAIILALAYAPILLAGRALNIGSLSDVEAASLGINLPKLRSLCFFSAAVTTGVSIMLSGPIGFVGLICPHICRQLVGADHRKLAVAAPFCGAAFLMLADTFVRATGLLFHGELPVGVITALCGGPFFLFLLKRRQSGIAGAGGDA